MSQPNIEHEPKVPIICRVARYDIDILTALALVDDSVNVGEQCRRGILEYLDELEQPLTADFKDWHSTRTGRLSGLESAQPISFLLSTENYDRLQKTASQRYIRLHNVVRLGLARYTHNRLMDPTLAQHAMRAR